MVLFFSFWQLIIYFVFSSSAIRPLVTYAFQAMVFPELLSWLFLTKSFRLDKNSRNMNDQNPSFEKLANELRIAIFFPGNFYLLTRQDKTTLFYQGSPVSCKAGILRGPGFNKNYI